MKRRYTAILFACALCVVVVALILTHLAQSGYDDYTDPQDAASRLISAQDFAHAPEITGIIVHRASQDGQGGQDDEGMSNLIYNDYLKMEVRIENRSDIQLSNLNCRGESLYKADQMQLSVEESILHISLKEDANIDFNNACSALSLHIPDDIQLLNLSALGNSSDITLKSDSAPQQLTVVALLGLNIAGQYKDLTVWQLWQEDDPSPRGYYNHSHSLNVINTADIKTLTYYSRNLHVNIDTKANIESGVLYGYNKGSLSIYDLNLINNLRFQALQSADLQQMAKFLQQGK